jgi:anhydro-N-acetylmuramic acid kinase
MSASAKVYTAIGLMSGTSLDGVDAALIETDGQDIIRPLGFLTRPYPQSLREALRRCFGKSRLDAAGREAELEMTLFHADTVRELLALTPAAKPDLIGFHGQTILHEPDKKRTVQIGDAALLADETGLDVIYDFRSNDVASGGQGAPLAPLYHAALAKAQGLEPPLAVLNIGGVANITVIGENEADLIAFDTGPGNALMDDMMKTRLGAAFDRNGHTAAKGLADQKAIARWMEHPHFSRRIPKSLDRDAWDIADDLAALSTEDALATLMAFTVRSIAAGFEHLPEPPKACYVCGGGRHNETLMVALQMALPCDVRNIDILGWNGDATEAECFGYLAVRSLLKLPISFPGTTGVPKPMTGGTLTRP